MNVTATIPIDLKRLKFSRYGSWMAWAAESRDGVGYLALKSLLGEFASTDIVWLEALGGGSPAGPEIAATPALLRCGYATGSLDICFPEPGQVRLRLGGGLRLRLHWNINENNLTPTAQGDWRLIGWNLGCKFRTNRIHGRFERTDGAAPPLFDRGVGFDLSPGEDGTAELMIERYLTEAPHRTDLGPFDQAADTVAAEFEAYHRASLPGTPEATAARAHAAYVNWSATVLPEGAITRPVMLMSNNWMRNAWNWDTFFNVMALSVHQPDLAWESVRLFFDHQAPDGQLPGYINNKQVNYTRPQAPMQGWTMGWILDHGGMLDRERIAYLQPRLERLLDWWLTCRDDTGSGFPYLLFPSDTGWDHCTPLHGNCPNRSPDVSAYLALVMETLGRFARLLGEEAQAQAWEARARDFAARICTHFWDGRRFRSPHAYTGAENPGDSLHNYRPLVLGQLLPAEIVQSIVAQLREEGRFLTPYGLASESLRSGFYVPDGYWRGAIWASTMLALIDGLRRAGEDGFARELAGRFCRLCEREGFAENFNATTGTAVRDPAYTWTSSVYLMLATYYR